MSPAEDSLSPEESAAPKEHEGGPDSPTQPPSTNNPSDPEATLPPKNDQTEQYHCDEKPASESSFDITHTVPGYELIEELGRGGMGIVFKARDRQLDRLVALKMILAGQFAATEDVQRFHTEARSVANLDHDGIVPIYEIGEHNGNHYFSMRLIEGGPLSDEVPRLTKDHQSAVRTMAQLARAVHHAHQRGILHRDLKPANVLMDEDGDPHITDFGLARQVEGDSGLTRTGAIMGTPSYMPPEQAQGKKEITTTADVYSLGAILYELLTGQPPFRSNTAIDTVLQVLNDPPKPPSEVNSKVDRGLELICLKCLSKDPNDRYGSAEALAVDLEHWLAEEPISVRPPTVTTLLRGWLRQNFGSIGWVSLIAPAYGLLLGAFAWLDMGEALQFKAMNSYGFLPSLDWPWLVPRWESNESIVLAGSFAVTLILSGTMGLIIVGLTRPKNRSADYAVALITGLVVAVTWFLSSFGWSVVRQKAVIPAEDDIYFLSQAG